MKTYVKPELSTQIISQIESLSTFDRFGSFDEFSSEYQDNITSYFGNSGVTI